ncbi:MAG: hypothetical protein ACOY3K_01895 [Candidatus Omnitrophota bacterium]
MESNYLYFEVSKEERDSSIQYLLGVLLKHREQDPRDEKDPCGEEVYVYLAHLLFSMALPEYHDLAEPYLAGDAGTLMAKVNQAGDLTTRYFLFKVNADHLLVRHTVFETSGNGKNPLYFQHSGRARRELAKLYYDQAAVYHQKIYHETQMVGDVLRRLGMNFEYYQRLLKKVRTDYFRYIEDFKDNVFRSFLRDLRSYESVSMRGVKMDQFLDLYSAWLKTHQPSLRADLSRVARELEYLDPGFHFPFQKLQQEVGYETQR